MGHEKQIFKSYVDHTSDGLLAFDRDLKLTYCSSLIESFAKLSEQEAAGKNALELFPFLGEIREDDFWRRVLERDLTSDLGPLTAHYFPVFSEQNQLIGASVVIKKKREFEFRSNAHTEREDLLSMASHELKTPLTALNLQLSYLQFVLKTRLSHTDEFNGLDEVTQLAQKQVKKVVSLIDSLLDVSKISDGKLDLKYSEVDLNQLVTETITSLREIALENGTEITFKQSNPILTQIDPFRMEQVISNLVTNAIKYGAQKPIQVRVDLCDSHAVLEVEDHGAGITPELHQKIFDKFHRGAESQRIPNGFGLGLFIVKKIMEAHQGSVTLNSTPGKGSTFQIKFPIRATTSCDLSQTLLQA